MYTPIDILRNWNIEGNLVDLSDHGYSGAGIFKVATETKSFVLKGYPKHITPNILRAIHKVMMEVRHGVEVIPKVIQMSNGETVLDLDGQAWELVEFLTGEHPSLDITGLQLDSLASTFGKFHTASSLGADLEFMRVTKPVKASGIHSDLLWWQDLTLELKEVLKTNGTHDLFASFVNYSTEIFDNHLRSIDWEKAFDQLPKTTIHRDLTKRNVLFHDQKVSAIIDFESMRYGTRLDDISRLMMEFTDASKISINQFVNTYQQELPLTQAELSHLPTYIRLFNSGVNFWAIRNFVDKHLSNESETEKIKDRIEKAIRVYAQLELK